MKKKDKIEIYLDIEDKEKLRAFAEKIGGTMAGIIKVALKKYLKENETDR